MRAPPTTFSSTVRCSRTRRPSMTWMIPIRAMVSGSPFSMRFPLNWTAPAVTWPSSGLSRPEIAFRVGLFPAPLAPSRATICPSFTSRLTPLRMRMMPKYFTSTLDVLSIELSLGAGHHLAHPVDVQGGAGYPLGAVLVGYGSLHREGVRIPVDRVNEVPRRVAHIPAPRSRRANDPDRRGGAVLVQDDEL